MTAPSAAIQREPVTAVRRSPSSWRPWALGWLVVGIYAVYFAGVARQHTAVPFFDQASYISRIYFIQENVERRGYFEAKAYLAGAYAGRPPLLLAPAVWLWGQEAVPQRVGLLWLGLRLGALMLGLWIAARVVGSARFVPLVLLVVLGGGFYLQATAQVYAMDHALGVFALLGVAALWWELKRPSAGSALALGGSVLGLILIKPAGLLLALPMLGVAVLHGTGWAWKQVRRRRRGRGVWRVVTWGAAWTVFWVLLAGILRSSYWQAALEFWRWGWEGWWAGARFAAWYWQAAVLMVPGWLGLLAGWAVWRALRRRGRRRFGEALRVRTGLSGWMLLAGGAVLAWWYCYNVWVGYCLDYRYPASLLPVGTLTAGVLVCGERRLGRVALAVGAVLLVVNLAIALGAGRPRALEAAAPLTGLVAQAEHPVAEVGLLAACRGVRAELAKRGQTRGVVCTLICDEYVEYAALNLAMRYETGNRWSPIEFVQMPWGADRWDVGQCCRGGWFLTKEPRSSVELAGDPFVGQRAMERLLRDPQSPLAEKVELVAQYRLRQPNRCGGTWFEPEPVWATTTQTLTLWRLTRCVSAAEAQRAQEWIRQRMKEGTRE